VSKEKYLLVVGVIENLPHSGGCMANICFNLEQDDELPERHRKLMESCQRLWNVYARKAGDVLKEMKEEIGE
jgi:hypothetical protein